MFWLLFAAIFILLLGLIEVALLRLLNKVWWDQKLIRRSAWALPILGVISVLLWGVGAYHNITWLSVSGSALTAFALVFEAALMLSLPFSGAIHLINWLLDRLTRKMHRPEPERPIDLKRRIFLKGAAAAVPMVTISASVAGVTSAFGKVNVYSKRIVIDNLPPDLHGLKILHLSDMHLRHYVTVKKLAEVVEQVRPFSPHLTLVTGDMADDIGQLPEALALLEELNTPLGTFASLGNHEYFRGVRPVRRIFDSTPIPLLVNEGRVIMVGQTPVFIGGLDDPQIMGTDHGEFFRKAIDTTLLGTGPDEFVLLLSHRPDAFDYASSRGVDLILAGHTHGGQIGWRGRSVFEASMTDSYLWGHYQRGNSHLYTSSGMGHWFPFRLGCPQEAPIIELQSA